MIAAKELCVCCLRHSDLDESKKKECIRRGTPPHWLGSDVRWPDAPARQDRDLPPLEAKAGRLVYACRINIRVKTKSDSHKEAYSVGLTTLFSATRQMSAISLSAAIGRGLPYSVVPEVNVMLGNGRREKSSRLFFLEIKSHRSAAHRRKVPEPYLVAAYGVNKAAPAADAAPELPLLRERFGVRPALTKGGLAQKAGPIDLVIARDYRQYWPRLTDSSLFAGDNLHLMKSVFHPGQLVFGEADPEAVGTMKKGVKRRLAQGMGETAGSSTSSSRRSREPIPAASSLGKRRRDLPLQSREREREKRKVRSPSPRPTSAASSSAGLQLETSTPSQRDKTDKSIEKSKDESPVRRTPARRKRARKISSDNSGSSSSSSSSRDSSSSSDSSSSEDEAMAEDKVIDRSV